ncbi:hypothetical protein KR009_006134 [Drosophila setifemur]|nr:hypothetical protein KR009_006134 [Drosophila setifemur]
MSVLRALVKLQALLALVGLVALTPLLISVAVLQKLFAKLCCCRSPKSIEGEVAVITGAGHGLGRAISLELAKKGCHIAAVDINLPGAQDTVKQIQESYKVQAKAYEVNVTNYADLVELNSKVVRDLGTVTVLINNAGILLHRNAVDPDPEQVQLMLDVNLTSHFWTKAVFLPSMKALRKGFIVTISSIAGIFALPYSSTYSASKAGTSAHMKALRMELALENLKDIYVTTVFPTFLRTNDEVVHLSRQVGIASLYPLVSGEEVAQRVVAGMVRGEQEILLPGLTAVLYRLIYLLPTEWQSWIILFLTGGLFNKFRQLRS